MISVWIRMPALVVGCASLAACAGDQASDGGIDSHPLTEMQAQLWVAPDGCKHWIIDDRQEGYLTPKLNRDGTPDCG
ncbi:MAG: hypothetical protein AAF501_01710 [Pseudomonadota bacterium]